MYKTSKKYDASVYKIAHHKCHYTTLWNPNKSHSTISRLWLPMNVVLRVQNWVCFSVNEKWLPYALTTREKVLSWEYRSPRKRNSRPPASVILCCPITYLLSLHYLRSRTVAWSLFTLEKSPVYGVLDSNLHTRLAVVTANELGLAFPSRNLPKKLRPDPSTFYLVIVVTNRQPDRQTDKPTPVIT